jgi:hypothetical protein
MLLPPRKMQQPRLPLMLPKQLAFQFNKLFVDKANIG